MSLPTLKQNVQFGFKVGVFVGVALALWASGVRLLVGAEAFRRLETTYPATLLSYLAGGPLLGALAGLLTPISRTKLGAAVVGIIVAFWFWLAIRFAMRGFREFDGEDVFAAVGFCVFGGGPVGVMLRTFVDELDAASTRKL